MVNNSIRTAISKYWFIIYQPRADIPAVFRDAPSVAGKSRSPHRRKGGTASAGRKREVFPPGGIISGETFPVDFCTLYFFCFP